MQFLNRLTIVRRLALLLVLVLAAVSALLSGLLVSERSMLMQERTASVQAVVNAAHGVVA